MRQIVLDTETTGLDPKQGHRIIEVAALELVNRRPTGKHFHEYIHPEREIDSGAQEIHGISLEFLEHKPRFAEIAPALVDFLKGAELIIHNAPFDTGFLNAELARLELGTLRDHCPSTLDTLAMARQLHPGKRNNLDALCERYDVDNTGRTLHGALLDAELLAEVYLAMTRGQDSFIEEAMQPHAQVRTDADKAAIQAALRVVRANTDELAAHQLVLESIQKTSQGKCVWLR